MGFGVAGCEDGFNQVIPNQLPCYLRAPLPRIPQLASMTPRVITEDY